MWGTGCGTDINTLLDVAWYFIWLQVTMSLQVINVDDYPKVLLMAETLFWKMVDFLHPLIFFVVLLAGAGGAGAGTGFP